jgi:hypothetical protein
METNKEINLPEFIEHQYLGFNRFNLFIRLMIAVACFGAYFAGWDQTNETNILFLIVGIASLVISIFLFFVLHIKTEINQQYLVVSGFWGARIIKVDLDNITNCEKVRYSRFLFNRPVYNLHVRGKVKFFTHGLWAVEITDNQGLKYRIGSQKSDELFQILKNKLNS